MEIMLTTGKKKEKKKYSFPDHQMPICLGMFYDYQIGSEESLTKTLSVVLMRSKVTQVSSLVNQRSVFLEVFSNFLICPKEPKRSQ